MVNNGGLMYLLKSLSRIFGILPSYNYNIIIFYLFILFFFTRMATVVESLDLENFCYCFDLF